MNKEQKGFIKGWMSIDENILKEAQKNLARYNKNIIETQKHIKEIETKLKKLKEGL